MSGRRTSQVVHWGKPHMQQRSRWVWCLDYLTGPLGGFTRGVPQEGVGTKAHAQLSDYWTALDDITRHLAMPMGRLSPRQGGVPPRLRR